MKINGVNHSKVHELADWLQGETGVAYGLCQSMAAGMIERLINFTHHCAPRGDIGRATNRVIAREMGWETEAEPFIAKLVEIGWLDENAEHRLVVHDWSVHAMEATKMSLSRRGETTFADGKPIRTPQCGDSVEPVSPQRGHSVATKRGHSSASASASASTSTKEEKEEASAAAAAPTLLPLGDEPPSKPKRREVERIEPPEAIEFADQFAESVQGVHPAARPPTPTARREWIRETRLMLEKDQRPLVELRAVADWLFNSPDSDAQFWRRNVLSVPKFREKFVKLDAARRSNHARQQPIRGQSAGERAVANIMARYRARG